MTVFQVTEKQKIQYLGSPKEVNPPGRGPATPPKGGGEAPIQKPPPAKPPQ